jgi:cytochrome c oxidase subunit 1
MSNNTEFRTCPTTGLKVDLAAEKLIKVNAVAAVVFLAIGGLFGLLVALTRWPEVHLLPADFFYLALTAHGLDVLLVWIIFFEMAVLYFASAVLLGSRLAAPKFAWAGFVLMLVGAVITNIVVLQGKSSVMFTSYVPLKAEPGFYLGIILFAVGALIGCFVFFATLVVARQERTYQGSIPLVTFGAMTAAIIAVFTIASGAIILIPTLLWSLGYVANIDPILYKTIWWAMGHSSQQINVAAHVSIWYAIAAMTFGAKPLSEKVSRMAFLMYILFLQIASAHHMLVEPGFSSEWKIFNTSYAMYLAVLGSMVHGMTVPGSIEAAQRSRGLNKGMFEWLRKAPWGNPAFAGMFMSLVFFGFIGGISAVVAGTTLAFMAITYYLVPLIFRRELMFMKLAKLQPYVFGIGVAGISVFMMGAGTLGVSRRHWDMQFADAVLPFDYPSAAFLMMGLNGMSAVLAAVGGIMFVVVVVGSVFFGRKLEKDEKPSYPEVPPQSAAVAQHGSAESLKIPGTTMLVAIFFIAFVLYYFVNWKYLSEIWPLS